jgi:serine protease Do
MKFRIYLKIFLEKTSSNFLIDLILNDNRSFEAKVIGTDPATDLALLRVDESNLNFIQLGNSDELEVGEWVLAVGNPFNLSTTVTAGIVSAKARNINIIQDQASVESFIQTDAAVNPGNSGGALVNLRGELIGINTAIASPTGAYAGYSFAVPVNMAKKVIDDLLNYGEVQRAYLGIYIRDVDSKISKELNLESAVGVLVDSVLLDGAADEAGLLKKDVIIKIDNEKVETSPRLQEIISSHQPGEKIMITLVRSGKEKKIKVTLKGKEGEMVVFKKERNKMLNDLGIVVDGISAAERENWKIDGGVKVTKIYPGIIRKMTGMKEGFIILKINKHHVISEEDFIKMLETTEGGVMLEGVYPEDLNTFHYYAFGL